MAANPSDATLRTAKIVAAFCSLAAGVYAAADAEPSQLVALFLSFGPLLAVILWLQRDARRTGVGDVHDLGLFIFLAWPVVIPWYAVKTRGRAGWPLAFGLIGLILSAYASWMLVAWLVFGLRYALGVVQAGA